MAKKKITKKGKPSVEEFVAESESERVQEAESQVSLLKRQLAASERRRRKDQGYTVVIREAVEEALRDIPPIVVPKPPPRSRKKRKETALLFLSDLHIGASTPTFSIEIARERLFDKLLPKLRTIVEMRRSAAKLDKIVVILGGDVVEGSQMRASQLLHIEQNVYDQAVHTAPRMMAEMIAQLGGDFPEVEVHGIFGNHGRPGKYGSVETSDKRVNWDSVCNSTAKLMLGDAVDGKHISFHVESEERLLLVPIGSKKFLFTHGDLFRGGSSFAGLPFYKIAQNIAKWGVMFGESFDYMVMGHFHRPFQGAWGNTIYWINGSIETGSEFARDVIGEDGRPAQRFWIVDDDHGVVADHLLWLD